MAYTPPSSWVTWDFRETIDLLRPTRDDAIQRALEVGQDLFVAGDVEILRSKMIVSVVGTRDITESGKKRAARLGRELAEADVVVMSGLARGVDWYAMNAARAAGGKIAGVIATPLDKATPKDSAELQEECYSNHVLVSQFPIGTRTHKTSFPARNKVMALLSDATVIIEAGETSGTIHQAAECKRIGRKLFFPKSLADEGIRWVDSFLADYENAHLLRSTEELIALLSKPITKAMDPSPEAGQQTLL